MSCKRRRRAGVRECIDDCHYAGRGPILPARIVDGRGAMTLYAQIPKPPKEPPPEPVRKPNGEPPEDPLEPPDERPPSPEPPYEIPPELPPPV